MSEQFIAEAQILVTPDTTGFRAQLLRNLNNAKRGVRVEVPVVPDMTGFRTALIEAVRRSSRNVVAHVHVVPDLTGFRAATAVASARSTSNLTATVGIRGAAAGAGGGPTTQPATSATRGAADAVAKETAAQKALTDAVNKAAFARQRLDSSLSTEERLTARLDREKLSLAAAEKAYTRALAEQNGVLAIQADQLRKAAIQQVARTKAQLAAPAAVDAARQAREAERAARAQERAGAAQTRLAARNAALVAKAQGPALAENAARDRLTKELTASELARSRAARQLAEAEQIEDHIGKKIVATRQALRTASSGVVAAEQAFAAATETSNKALIQKAELELNAARAAKIDAAANLEAAEAEKLRLGRIGQARQGIIATVAQLTGLRGAALSAQASFIAAAAGVVLFARSVKSAADFASELSTFRVVAGATAAEMDKVSAKAQTLGTDITLPGVAASDAAVAMTELAKAGLSVQDSMDAARGVLQLATAAQIDNSEATNLAASALNAFGLAGDQAVHVADVLANAANASQGSIVDMGIALQQSAAVGRQAGLSLEQTTAALTILARAGLRGSDAGTSLRTALIRLINPTKKAQEQIKDLGLHLRTASGAINLNVFDEFAKKTRDMSRAQRDQALAVIFGQDAIRAAAILARTGAKDLQAQIDNLNKSGTAAEVAAARMTGLTGAGANLKNQLETLGLTVGGLATGPLAALADALADNIAFANRFITALKSLPSKIPLPDIEIGPIDTEEQGRSLGQKLAEGIKIGAATALKGAITALIFPPVGLVPGGTVTINALVDQFLPTKTLEDKSKDVRKQVDEILATFRQLGNNKSGLNLNVALTSLDALADKLEKGDADSQKLAESVRLIRKQLADPKIITGFKIAPIKIPPELQRGDAGREVGEAALKGFEEGLPPNKLFGLGAFASQALADGIEAGKGDVGKAVNNVVAFFQDELQAAINKGAGRVAKRASGRQRGLEEEFNEILIGGGTPGQQIANLRKQAAQQQKIIDANTGATEAQIKARRTAKDKLAQIVGQITSLQDQQTQTAKQAAQDIKTKQDVADQAVVDAFTPTRNQLALQEIRVSQTKRLNDDLAFKVSLANTISGEIKIIQDTVRDQKKKKELIAARVQELAQTGADIDALIKQMAENEKERRQKARDAITTRLGKELQLAQLVGNKDAVLNAFDKAIADAKKRVANWKKLGLVQIDERIALAQLVKDRKDFLDEAKDATKGTTAFDLLQQAAQTFINTGGNLIGGNQPFAGPTGFTADLAQFLKRQRGGATGAASAAQIARGLQLAEGITIGTGGVTAQKRQRDASIDDLITALDRNTAAILGREGGGNKSTASQTLSERVARARFSNSGETREAIMARTGI